MVVFSGVAIGIGCGDGLQSIGCNASVIVGDKNCSTVVTEYDISKRIGTCANDVWPIATKYDVRSGGCVNPVTGSITKCNSVESVGVIRSEEMSCCVIPCEQVVSIIINVSVRSRLRIIADVNIVGCGTTKCDVISGAGRDRVGTTDCCG